mgnify:CR=1 FL=1
MADVARHTDLLRRGDTGLIVVDVQEGFRPVIDAFDAMARNVAFLSIDVVGSTAMKVGEDKAFIEHDFKEYKKMVEAAIGGCSISSRDVMGKA